MSKSGRVRSHQPKGKIKRKSVKLTLVRPTISLRPLDKKCEGIGWCYPVIACRGLQPQCPSFRWAFYWGFDSFSCLCLLTLYVSLINRRAAISLPGESCHGVSTCISLWHYYPFRLPKAVGIKYCYVPPMLKIYLYFVPMSRQFRSFILVRTYIWNNCRTIAKIPFLLSNYLVISD